MMKVYLIGLLGILFLSFSSCTSNLGSSSKNIQTFIGSTTTAFVATPGSNIGAFTLNQVLPNSNNPTQVLDLIGDGSGAFGNLCLSTDGSSSSTSATTCSCVLSYSSTLNPNQTIEIPVIYHESNLLRCQFPTNFPQEITTVSVSIQTISSTSNVIDYALNRPGLIVDTSDITNFSKVKRYQCRPYVFIDYPLDDSIIHPIASEDPRLTYGINFYTTRLADTISKYAASGQSDWNCPPILTPDDYLSTSDPSKTDLNNYYLNNNINLTIFSQSAPTGGGSKLIYPPQQGAFDRSTFYLSNTSTGAFNVPFNAYIAPNLMTSTGSADFPPIGYGASAVASGTAQESCPDTSVPIPSGFHWVKVWLFRASLPPKKYPSSAGITGLGSITCYPGAWTTDSAGATYAPTFTGCNTAASRSVLALTTGAPGKSIYTTGAYNFTLADRVLGTGQCVGFDNGTSAPFSCAGGVGAGCIGSDQWYTQSPSSSASICPQNNPMGTCPPTGGPANVAVQPKSSSITFNSISASLYDFIVVISPTSTTYSDMIALNANSQIYTPLRFPVSTDCVSNDPDNCDSTLALNKYKLVTHDVGSNDDPSIPRVFPICAIQPN